MSSGTVISRRTRKRPRRRFDPRQSVPAKVPALVLDDELEAAARDLVDPLVLVSFREAGGEGLVRVDLPSRLQLLAEGEDVGQGLAARAGVVPGSRPPMRLECLTLLGQVSAGLDRLEPRVLSEMRLDDAWRAAMAAPAGRSVAERVRFVVGLARSTPKDGEARLIVLAKLRGWRMAADAVLGLSETVLQPHVYCMRCDRTGSVRVTLDESRAPVEVTGGYCTACHAHWAEGWEVANLRRWIGWSFEHLQGREHRVDMTGLYVPVSVAPAPFQKYKPRKKAPARRYRRDPARVVATAAADLWGVRAEVESWSMVCRECRGERERHAHVLDRGYRMKYEGSAD